MTRQDKVLRKDVIHIRALRLKPGISRIIQYLKGNRRPFVSFSSEKPPIDEENHDES